MRTYVRVTSEGSAHTRFRRAIAVGNGSAAYAAATELPPLQLPDALALTLLLADDPELFERACVRWVARFTLEVRGVRCERHTWPWRRSQPCVRATRWALTRWQNCAVLLAERTWRWCWTSGRNVNRLSGDSGTPAGPKHRAASNLPGRWPHALSTSTERRTAQQAERNLRRPDLLYPSAWSEKRPFAGGSTPCSSSRQDRRISPRLRIDKDG